MQRYAWQRNLIRFAHRKSMEDAANRGLRPRHHLASKSERERYRARRESDLGIRFWVWLVTRPLLPGEVRGLVDEVLALGDRLGALPVHLPRLLSQRGISLRRFNPEASARLLTASSYAEEQIKARSNLIVPK